jgi:saccharopine dehydrogenase (NAD+, L-lysine forming)
MAVIGLIREGKKPFDKRVALSPEQCLEIIEHFPGTQIIVQSSSHRCFKDEEYSELGIEVKEDISECDILFGVKEVPVDELIPSKTYFFFSHTIKKQPYNRNLLRTVLQKNIRLVDYETLVWENGNRVLGFGRFAGIVGAHEGLAAWGKKTGKFELKPAWQCATYKEMIDQYENIKPGPLKIAVCGDGRVAHGCIEVLKKLNYREVTSQEFLEESYSSPVYVHLLAEDFYTHKDGLVWDKSNFYHDPESYESSFAPYTEKCDLMMNAIFWNERIPRFFSIEDMKSRKFNIKVIADISCDINGSIPATLKDTTIDNPVFGYHPFSETIEAPYQSDTIDIMAVSNLPCELPLDASESFGDQLIRHVMGELLKIENSRMISDATIAKDGALTKKYSYLSDYVA